MPAYGIDTSVFVRVLTGLPAADYQTTVKRLASFLAAAAPPWDFGRDRKSRADVAPKRLTKGVS